MHQAASLICHGFGNSRVGVPQIADCNSSHKIRIGVTLFIRLIVIGYLPLVISLWL